MSNEVTEQAIEEFLDDYGMSRDEDIEETARMMATLQD